jgi:pimeloyl-ACP methyl ester carboxylesterase
MQLALHTWGPPDAGKTALLIHGAMSSHATWSGVAAELVERGYHVIAPDLRGHRDSPQADSYTSADFAADLVESLPKGADLAIGHSLGGRSLLIAAEALAPERAVYSDPSWVTSSPVARAMRAVLVEFAMASKVMTERQIARMNPRWSAEDVMSEWTDYQVWDQRVLDGIRQFKDQDIPVPKVPSLVLAADPSSQITPEYEAQLTGLGYTVRTVKGTGHVIHRDDLQGFLVSLDGWI